MSAAHEANNLSFIENAVEAAAASGVNVAALNALQQATEADHSEAADPANASSTAAAALGSLYPTMHVPTSTEQQFAAAAQAASDMHSPQDDSMADVTQPDTGDTSTAGIGTPAGNPGGGMPDNLIPHYRKPAVGSPEWHKIRKDNHKEGSSENAVDIWDLTNHNPVERRRRETINEGINELAKIVPGCEKNKGSILQKAVQFIQQLKSNEASNIEKWTLEKLLTEQAIGELSQSNDKLKKECERLYRELETYKRVCQGAGLEVPATTDASATNTSAA
jgi:bHLH factor